MSEPISVFVCGPGKCEHDFSVERRDYYENGNPRSSWYDCSKCGMSNMDWHMWQDDEPAAPPEKEPT